MTASRWKLNALKKLTRIIGESTDLVNVEAAEQPYFNLELFQSLTVSCYRTGMDFGYTNDPTALVKVYKRGNELIFDELLYHTNLTNQDIAQKFEELELNRLDVIYADSAEPKSIEELHRMRWNVKPTVKGADSIMAGIDMLKRYELKVTAKSLNLIKEFQNYKWIEDKNGNLLNKPVNNFDHAIDAIRYAVYNKLSKPNYGSYALR
jgi:phage terminase large subunit